MEIRILGYVEDFVNIFFIQFEINLAETQDERRSSKIQITFETSKRICQQNFYLACVRTFSQFALNVVWPKLHDRSTFFL